MTRRQALLTAVASAVAFAVPVALLALVVRERLDLVLDLDESAIRSATDITRGSPGLRTALLWWQEITQPRWVYLAGSALCLWTWRRHGLRGRSLWAFVTMMVAWNVALDLKYLVRRARPAVADPVSHAPGFSFPSGHAANAAAAAAIVVILLWPLIKDSAARYAVPATLSVVVVLTALDRVFLGVHYPSDVVAGVLVGTGLAASSYLGYRGWNPARPPPVES